MLVKGNTLLGRTSFSNRDRNTENGVGAEFALVRCPVELDQEIVDILLLGDDEAALNKFRGDNVVDVGNSLGNTLKAGCGMVRIDISIYEPFPTYALLSPSRSSTASWIPVEAPEGTAAR